MKRFVSIGRLDSLLVNPDWAKLPLFERRGWKRLPFGAFAESVNERVEPANAADEIYVGLDDLDSGNLHISRWGKGSDVIGTKLRFRKGDIIFGRRRAYQRKLAVAEFDGICSAHAMVVRARPELVLPEFLPFLMMSDHFMNRAVEISVGSLSPTINWKALKLEEFDFPSLAQQRRIAEILWEIDGALQEWGIVEQNTEVARIAKVQGLFLGVPESVSHTFRGIEDFQLPNRWEMHPARNLVCSPITKGATPSSHLNTATATVPFLKVYNLTFSGELDFGIAPTYLESKSHNSDLKRSRVYPGDILMNIVGPPLGKTALVPEGFPEANINQAIALYRIEDPVLRAYFFEYLRSTIAQNWLARGSKKTSGQQNLTLQLAQDLPVPIPTKPIMAEVIVTANRFKGAQAEIRGVQAAVLQMSNTLVNQLCEVHYGLQ